MEGAKIMITGGGGFIGTAIAQRLCHGNQLLLFDNLTRNSIVYTDLLSSPKVRLVEGDIRDQQLVARVLHEFMPDVVFHLAAINGIFTVSKKPLDTMEVNFIGAYNLFKAATGLKGRIGRIINISTGEVYGKHSYCLTEEDATPVPAACGSRWSYAASKLAVEHLAYCFYIEQAVPITTIRPCGVYGPGQVGEGAVHIFVKNALCGEDILVHGDGNQIRSWCYIDDFVDGAVLAADSDSAAGEIFNIGNPDATVTIYQLAQKVKRLASSDSVIRKVAKGYADVDIRVVNTDKADRMLGYKPKWSLEEGLSKTIDWYRGRRSCDGHTPC